MLVFEDQLLVGSSPPKIYQAMALFWLISSLFLIHICTCKAQMNGPPPGIKEGGEMMKTNSDLAAVALQIGVEFMFPLPTINSDCSLPENHHKSFSMIVNGTGRVYTLWYAGRSLYEMLASAALRRDIKTDADGGEGALQGLCPTLIYWHNVYMLTVYQNTTWVRPMPYFYRSNLSNLKILPFGVMGNAAPFGYYMKKSIPWSDGSKHSLFVQCVDGARQWKLASREGPPDDSVKELVNLKLKDVGFDEKDTYDYTGRSCPTENLNNPIEYTNDRLDDLGIAENPNDNFLLSNTGFQLQEALEFVGRYNLEEEKPKEGSSNDNGEGKPEDGNTNDEVKIYKKRRQHRGRKITFRIP